VNEVFGVFERRSDRRYISPTNPFSYQLNRINSVETILTSQTTKILQLLVILSPFYLRFVKFF